jgi:hypothetical protein
MMRWDVVGEWVRTRGYTRGVEVGVKAGENFLRLLESCPGLVLYGVDIFEPRPGLEAEGGESYATCNLPGQYAYLDEILTGRIPHSPTLVGTGHLIRALSVDAAATFSDGSLDFVFIDADHREAAVLEDIRAWHPKVRAGGVLCGHDAEVPLRHRHTAGVLAAVNRACPGWIHHPDSVWEWRVPA